MSGREGGLVSGREGGRVGGGCVGEWVEESDERKEEERSVL